MSQKLTAWSEPRLLRLFDRYNRVYWRGRLPSYRIVNGPCPDNPKAWGQCERGRRRIWVDMQQHASDREVRSTLLHEMAHAAAREKGHGIRFFAQVEKLLRKGAPIVGVGLEAEGEAVILEGIVPARFPLLKRRMDRAEAERRCLHERLCKNIPSTEITDDDIIRRFEYAALSLPWKKALVAVGLEHGLTDETGRPKNRWAVRLVARGKKAHARARRDLLAESHPVARMSEEEARKLTEWCDKVS